MNGRVYDPRLGRFLQADPYVQYVDDTQSFNRYSYVFNNPLNATDPSGFLSFSGLVDAVVLVVGAIIELFCTCGAGIELVNWWFNGPSQLLHSVENFYMAHNAFSNGNFFTGLYYFAQGVMGVSSKIKGGNRLAQSTSAGTVSGMTDGNFTNGAYTGSFFSTLQEAGDVVLENQGLDEKYLHYAQLADAALEDFKDEKGGGQRKNPQVDITDFAQKGLPEIFEDEKFRRALSRGLSQSVSAVETEFQLRGDNIRAGVVVRVDDSGSYSISPSPPSSDVIYGLEQESRWWKATFAGALTPIRNASALAISVPRFERNNSILGDVVRWNDLSLQVKVPVVVTGRNASTFVFTGSGDPIEYEF